MRMIAAWENIKITRQNQIAVLATYHFVREQV
jgi:hypothetical protein